LLEENFTMLRPIYYLLSTVALFNVVYLIIYLKKNDKFLIYIPLNTLLILIISSVLFYLEGYITDALSMSGNSLGFDSTLFIFICFLLNLIFPFFKNRKRDVL